jgi:ABC-2 type transport system permease protein
MRNIFLVARHEIVTTLKKRSYWFFTIVFPGLIIGLNLVMQGTVQNEFGGTQDLIPEGGAGVPVLGYVDRSGLIQKLPAGLPTGLLQKIDNEADALLQLQSGQIDQYFVIPGDFLESGRLVQVVHEVDPMNTAQSGLLEYLIYYNLTGDENLTQRLVQPAILNTVALAPVGRDETSPAAFFIPFATMFIFFLTITMSSGFMLQSVTREKENRTVESLLLSLSPRHLMLGKVFAYSVVALIQISIWLGAGLLALERSRTMLETVQGLELPVGFVAWALLYFIFGYLTYAAIMGAIGALAPTMREGSQVTFLAIFPLLLPLWMSNSFIFSPNGGVAVFLSLFPLTSPTSMVTRMVSTQVPLWQNVLALVLLAFSTYFFISLAARFFRADNLLSASPLSLRRLWRELRQPGKSSA